MAAVSTADVAKAAVRREFSLRRKSLDAEVRRQYDAGICDQIRNLRCFNETECVAGFIRHGAEPDLSPLFKGKRLFLPRFDAERGVYEIVAVNDLELDLLPGKYNIPEPSPSLPAADPDFVASQVLFLVPAVACDRQGHRLGRGGGYYDRLLAGVKKPPVAVIYSCQISEQSLPGTAHDIPMGMVVTEREVIRVTQGTGE
jgi:5-formyltetrahydrofolate cyclo-ligase